MKSLLLMFLFLAFTLFAQDSSNVNITDSTQINSGTLTIKIVDISNDDGGIMIAMSDSRENYENFSDPLYKAKSKIKDGISFQKFDNIPYGEYAVKVFHDENDDNKMDKGFMGIPSEDYGFSNDASGSFGPADYDDAKFIFDLNNNEITISVD